MDEELKKLMDENQADLDEFLIKPLAQTLVDTEVPSGLESQEAHFRRIYSQLKNSFKDFQQYFVKAGETLKNGGFVLETVDPSLLESLKKDEKLEEDEFKSEPLPYESMGITYESLQKMAEIAQEHYSSSSFENARNIYLLLTTLDPSESNYWFGLGQSLQKLEAYEQAVMSYNMAADLDSEDPSSYLNVAFCLTKMNRLQEAIAILDVLIQTIEDGSDQAEVKVQARLLKNEWQKVA